MSAVAFRPEYLDFQRGIRVGKLEENERISRILKLALEDRYQEAFVTEKYGRGSYWQWMGFLSRANRLAKPVSSHISFGCSKFFIMIDRQDKLFKCGLQVERGFLKASKEYPSSQLQEDWDWNRLLKALTARSRFSSGLKRLVCNEGFFVEGGTWDDGMTRFSKTRFPEISRLKKLLEEAHPERWGGFQVYYPMDEKEVGGSNGIDLVEAMLAVFDEVTPLMNECMQIQLSRK